MVIGHRGASAVAPENTLAAFRRAISDGSNGVEFDVRITADGVPVVIHDPTLRRTGAAPGAIEQMTASQLSQVDVGSWFNRWHSKLAQKDYEGEHLPLLEDVFELFTQGNREFQNTRLYVELKGVRNRALTTNLARQVVKQIASYKLEERATVLSFDIDTIDEIKRNNPDVAVGVLFKPSIASAKMRRNGRLISVARRHGVSEIGLHHLLASRRTVTLAVENNLKVIVWTVNHPKWLARARAWRISALITNDPAKMIGYPHDKT